MYIMVDSYLSYNSQSTNEYEKRSHDDSKLSGNGMYNVWWFYRSWSLTQARISMTLILFVTSLGILSKPCDVITAEPYFHPIKFSSNHIFSQGGTRFIPLLAARLIQTPPPLSKWPSCKKVIKFLRHFWLKKANFQAFLNQKVIFCVENVIISTKTG